MGETSRKGSFRVFGIHSIFTKTFLSLILLCVVLMAFFNHILSRTMLESQLEKERSANLTALNQIADSIDLTFSVMAQSMSQTVWSSDIIAFLVNPYKRTPERDYRVIQLLDSHARGSGLVSGAYVYSPLSGAIYGSDGQVAHIADFAYGDALRRHLSEWEGAPGATEKSDSDTVTRLLVEGGRLFVFTDLIVSKHLGTLFFELDSRELYRSIGNGDQSDQEAVYVYDRDGVPVFAAESGGGPSPDFGNEAVFLMRDRPATDPDIALFYLAVSGKCGWRYLRPVDHSKLELGMGDLLRILLPVLVALLGVSILFTAYITSTVYRPINRLMQSISAAATGPASGRRPAKTEIDYLEHAYRDTIGRQSELSGLISSITPDILEHLLRGLLLGREIDGQYIQDTLEGVGSPIAVDSRYCVIVGMTKSPANRPSTSTEASLYYISIRRILESVQNQVCRVTPVSTDTDSIVIVFSCPPACSITLFKQAISETVQEIERHVRHYPYQFSMGRGRIYNHIDDLKYSYREALEELHYILYNQDAAGGASPPLPGDSRQQDHYYIRTRAKHIIQAVNESRTEEAIRLAERVVDEVGASGRAAALYSLLADELMERLITYQVSDRELADLRRHRLLAGAETEGDGQGAKDFCREVIRIIGAYSHKNQYKYVADAKDYITENYADSSLSLQDVSAHVGIHSSYLSELFGDVAKQPFTDYLNNYRVDKSKQMLANTGLTVKEIGFRCGFNSAQNYIRVFKRITDMTPGQYRDMDKA